MPERLQKPRTAEAVGSTDGTSSSPTRRRAPAEQYALMNQYFDRVAPAVAGLLDAVADASHNVRKWRNTRSRSWDTAPTSRTCTATAGPQPRACNQFPARRRLQGALRCRVCARMPRECLTLSCFVLVCFHCHVAEEKRKLVNDTFDKPVQSRDRQS